MTNNYHFRPFNLTRLSFVTVILKQLKVLLGLTKQKRIENDKTYKNIHGHGGRSAYNRQPSTTTFF